MERIDQLRGDAGGIAAHRREVAADAEAAARAGEDDGTHVARLGQPLACGEEGPGGRHVEGVERRRPVELQHGDGAVAAQQHRFGWRGFGRFHALLKGTLATARDDLVAAQKSKDADQAQIKSLATQLLAAQTTYTGAAAALPKPGKIADNAELQGNADAIKDKVGEMGAAAEFKKEQFAAGGHGSGRHERPRPA